ncbi:hypothetical protein [Microbacterium sp. MYb64]|uniref:hypothetical protein n=1 Tax=Microbacterium sp. MYb64 TaxID=1848691 RepID=UPI000CFD571D|nr:hypothetical protein [Microbacterium sp. MYb64]PRB01768.1 hypothetical protein CQ044_16600 [Microbacterium sp. MYb64]
MSDVKQVLQVTVTAERLPDGHEAYGVEIESDPRMPAGWAADFLHGVATSIETDGFDTPEDD